MPAVQSGLFILMAKFPDRREFIKRLFRKNESFQTMCEDYFKCSQALKHWHRSGFVDADSRAEEYAALLRDLEAEIEQVLNECA